MDDELPAQDAIVSPPPKKRYRLDCVSREKYEAVVAERDGLRRELAKRTCETCAHYRRPGDYHLQCCWWHIETEKDDYCSRWEK